jgi:hypothetical protein
MTTEPLRWYDEVEEEEENEVTDSDHDHFTFHPKIPRLLQHLDWNDMTE